MEQHLASPPTRPTIKAWVGSGNTTTALRSSPYSFCIFVVLIGIDGVKQNIDLDDVLNGQGTQEKD